MPYPGVKQTSSSFQRNLVIFRDDQGLVPACNLKGLEPLRWDLHPYMLEKTKTEKDNLK